MSRAQGSRAQMGVGFESTYGTPPDADAFWRVPFASSNLGSEQPLLESELLGYGRDPLPPVLDAVTADGEVVVPVDERFIGIWLKGGFGAPASSTQVAATGTITFSAQPAASSTITINGVEFTFVAGSPSSNEIQIGATLPDTLDNIISELNGSSDTDVDDATYTEDGVSVLTITHDTAGTAGNAFTLAASATSNGTVSAATLLAGGYLHEFRSGGFTLPSLAIETGMPEVPSFGMVAGNVVESLGTQMNRSGLITMNVNLVGQYEVIRTASAAGTLEELTLARFGAFNGQVLRNGVQLGNIVSANWQYSNNLDRIETIRSDGYIDGADPTVASFDGTLDVRFADHTLLDQAVAGEACSLSFDYVAANGRYLKVLVHEVYLPRPRRALTGQQGVQTTFAFQAAKNVGGTERMVTATLLNDLANYDNPS